MSETLEKVQNSTYPLPVEGDESAYWQAQLATRRETYDVLVLDARLRQSLAAVRSLGSRGLRVAALGSSDREETF